MSAERGLWLLCASRWYVYCFCPFLLVYKEPLLLCQNCICADSNRCFTWRSRRVSVHNADVTIRAKYASNVGFAEKWSMLFPVSHGFEGNWTACQHCHTVHMFVNWLFAGSPQSAAILLNLRSSVQWRPPFRLQANCCCLILRPRSWRLVSCTNNCCSACNILSTVHDTQWEKHWLKESRA